MGTGFVDSVSELCRYARCVWVVLEHVKDAAVVLRLARLHSTVRFFVRRNSNKSTYGIKTFEYAKFDHDAGERRIHALDPLDDDGGDAEGYYARIYTRLERRGYDCYDTVVALYAHIAALPNVAYFDCHASFDELCGDAYVLSAAGRLADAVARSVSSLSDAQRAIFEHMQCIYVYRKPSSVTVPLWLDDPFTSDSHRDSFVLSVVVNRALL